MGRAENKNIAISFENVSKMYRLGLVGTGTLGQDLNRWWRMSVLHQAKGKYSLNFNISKFDYTAIVRDYDIAYGAIKFEVKFVDAKHTNPFWVWPPIGGCAFNKSMVQIK
ncbi:MAG: hypothetical protein IJR02_05530 [Bacteroidaceae bacterium]|nr:hypothetical protein [Bacteroidaceae bacterium]